MQDDERNWERGEVTGHLLDAEGQDVYHVVMDTGTKFSVSASELRRSNMDVGDIAPLARTPRRMDKDFLMYYAYAVAQAKSLCLSLSISSVSLYLFSPSPSIYLYAIYVYVSLCVYDSCCH